MPRLTAYCKSNGLIGKHTHKEYERELVIHPISQSKHLRPLAVQRPKSYVLCTV